MSCIEPFSDFPIYLSCLGDCWNAVWPLSFRSVLWNFAWISIDMSGDGWWQRFHFWVSFFVVTLSLIIQVWVHCLYSVFYSHGQQNMQKNLNDSHHKCVKYHHENTTGFYVKRCGGNGKVTFLSYLFISEICFDPLKWCLTKTAVLFHLNVFCSTFIGLSRTRANFMVPLWQFSVLLCSLCFHTKAQQIRNGIITVGGTM